MRKINPEPTRMEQVISHYIKIYTYSESLRKLSIASGLDIKVIYRAHDGYGCTLKSIEPLAKALGFLDAYDMFKCSEPSKSCRSCSYRDRSYFDENVMCQALKKVVPEYYHCPMYDRYYKLLECEVPNAKTI